MFNVGKMIEEKLVEMVWACEMAPFKYYNVHSTLHQKTYVY